MKKHHWATTLVLGAVAVLISLAIGINIGECKRTYAYCQSQDKYLAALADVFPAVFDFFGANLSTVSTVATALFTGTLWWSTRKLWRATKKSIGVSRKQMLLAGLSADLAQKQHGVARHQFFATHRPKLRVRLVMFNQRNQGQPIALQCEIANVGNSEATVVRGEIELHVDFGAGVVGAKELGGNRKILAGDSLLAVANLDVIYSGDWDLQKPMERKVRISGFVMYEDVLGTKRKTAFWRLYDHGRKGFFPEEPVNTDREYED